MVLATPEKEQTAQMLRGLMKQLVKLDPTEHQADCHLDMSADPDDDLETLMLSYGYDEADARDRFDELQIFFDDNYMLTKSLLAKEWSVDPRDVAWPEDESQHAACYLSTHRSEDYTVSVSRWMQPTPGDESAAMLVATLDPQWSMSSAIRVIYLGDKPLLGYKFNTLCVDDAAAPTRGTSELNPDDVMTAEKVIRRLQMRIV